MDKIQPFLKEITAFQLDTVLLIAGIVISIAGIVLLYKKGPWLGLLISVSGILLVIIAALARFLS